MIKNFNFLILLTTLLLTVSSCTDNSWSDEEGGTTYNPDDYPKNASKAWIDFVEGKKTGKLTTLIDFSYAGYGQGEVEPPTVTHPIYNVTDYGAVADDGISDRLAFIATIAAAEKAITDKEINGAIIFVPKGQYDLSAESDDRSQKSTITINKSNIVLRGEGSGEDGTKLFMEFPGVPNDVNALWTGPPMINIKGGYSHSDKVAITSNADRGSFSVEVASKSDFIEVGNWVRISVSNNSQTFINEELYPFMEKINADASIRTNGVSVWDYQQIAAIDGNKITFTAPITRRINAEYGWTLTKILYSEENGVEDIAFIGNWTEPFDHHANYIHDSGFKTLVLANSVNSWVRRCRFKNVSEALIVDMSANVSVYDCVVEGNRGHAAIRSNHSSRVFLGALEDRATQWHSFGVGGAALGTVIWRTKTGPDSSFEIHANQPRATLIDACKSGYIGNRGGGAAAAMPNHLRDLVFWNFNQTNAALINLDFSGTYIQPIIVGWHGATTTFKQGNAMQHNESNGSKVYPESLYEAQLELRLGAIPAWLTALK